MNIKNALAKLGMSYAAIAAEVDVSAATISQIINHEQWPKRNAAALRSRLQDFFKSEGLAVALPILAAKPNPQNDEDNIMLLRKSTITQTARQHFSLARDPFHEEIGSGDDVFASPDIRYVREAMYQTATQGGFVAVVGESGAGKSTLREDLHDRLERDSRPVIIIEPYVLAMEDNDVKGKTLKAAHIAESILEAVSPGTSPRRSPEARFRQVHQALQESHRTGNRHVLIIEEAHGMPIPTLKHLKRFFELKSGFARLIGIVLIGQTELGQKLSENNPSVREVVQRCELVTLQPLTDGRLQQYLKFKFERAGKKLDEVMDDSALDAITERLTVRSRTKNGLTQTSLLYPLAVNNLTSAAINEAAELGFPKVNADIVKAV